jgi:hypothetical protein
MELTDREPARRSPTHSDASNQQLFSTLLGIKRGLRCHTYHPSGDDLEPPRPVTDADRAALEDDLAEAGEIRSKANAFDLISRLMASAKGRARLGVACPRCHAAAGELCVHANGTANTYVQQLHAERQA